MKYITAQLMTLAQASSGIDWGTLASWGWNIIVGVGMLAVAAWLKSTRDDLNQAKRDAEVKTEQLIDARISQVQTELLARMDVQAEQMKHIVRRLDQGDQWFDVLRDDDTKLKLLSKDIASNLRVEMKDYATKHDVAVVHQAVRDVSDRVTKIETVCQNKGGSC